MERALRVTQPGCRPRARTPTIPSQLYPNPPGEITPHIQPQFPALLIIFISPNWFLLADLDPAVRRPGLVWAMQEMGLARKTRIIQLCHPERALKTTREM